MPPTRTQLPRSPGRRASDRRHRTDLQRLRTAFLAAPTGIAVMDLDGTLTEVNPALGMLCGAVPPELVGTVLTDLFEPEDAAPVADALQRALERPRREQRLEVRCRPRAGDLHWAELTVSHVGGDADTQCLVAHLRDVDAAHEAADRLQRFASLASHDLSGPLASISAVLALVERRAGDHLPETDRRLLGAARERAEDMRGLVEDMLEYARGGAPLHLAPVDLADLAAEALSSTGAELTAAQVGDLPMVLGDRAQLLRVLRNLLDNAAKHGGATVELGAEPIAAGWAIHVADRGSGVREEDRARIFDMLERAAPADRPGSGLGLAICTEVIDRHGGEIWVEPRDGGGSRFVFTLPGAGP